MHEDERRERYLFAFGRLKPDVTPERALEDLSSIARRLEERDGTLEALLGLLAAGPHAGHHARPLVEVGFEERVA